MSNGSRRVTIRDIAEEAGVSEATVSLALSGKGRISDKTRRLVWDVARSLDYRPNAAARSLALKRHYEVGHVEAGSTPIMRPGDWEFVDIDELLGLVEAELAQRKYEGYKTAAVEVRASQVMEQPTIDALEALMMEMEALEIDLDFPYEEPSELNAIRARSNLPEEKVPYAFNVSDFACSILGGWLGRTIGCVLGKPLENGLTKAQIVEYLKMADSFPLNDYVPEIIPVSDECRLNPFRGNSTLGRVDGAPADDDLDYTILNLHILEEYGMGVTTEQIATEWLNHLPFFNTYTAERVAYTNLVKGLRPPHTAHFRNPWREQIGAQIRGDCLGWACPGDPELATELAFRDARLTHTRNGIYGEMYVSALTAMAPIEKNAERLIRTALRYVPAQSRFAEAVQNVMKWANSHGSWEETFELIDAAYGCYGPIHVLNNACVVTMALLYSEGNFDQGLRIAVTSGWDTDCNAATVGAALGTMLGADAIPYKWIEPLQDTIFSNLAHFSRVSISDLAQRTFRVAEKRFSALTQDREESARHPSVIEA